MISFLDKEEKVYRIRLLQIVLTVAFLLSCAPKKFVWHGQHITIATAEHPREDFKAGEYIVVAYAPIEYKKNPDIVFRFSIYKDDNQVGLISAKSHVDWPVGTTKKMYLLEENNFCRSNKIYYLIQNGDKLIYQIYEGLPTYKQIRGDVLTILLGGELVPPPPFDNEEARKMLYLIQ